MQVTFDMIELSLPFQFQTVLQQIREFKQKDYNKLRNVQYKLSPDYSTIN